MNYQDPVYLAKQLFLNPSAFSNYDWIGRTITYHCFEIHDYFNFREIIQQDIEEMVSWLCQFVLYHNHELNYVEEQVYQKFRSFRVEPPISDKIEHLILSTFTTYEKRFLMLYIKVYQNKY